MNIRELLKSEAKISLTVGLEDLRQVFKELITSSPRLIKEDLPPEEFISRKEVLNRLEIDSSTLWNWEKTGYIKSYPFGGRKRYKAIGKKMEHGIIKYYSADDITAKPYLRMGMTYFGKRDKYSYQNEYRIIFNDKDAQKQILHLGPLDDICYEINFD